MHIALVSQPYYPIPGGVTEHVWHLGRELARRGYAVTVVTGGGLGVEDRGLRVIRIGQQIPLMLNGAHVHVTLGWRLAKKLQQVEERERFDLIHIQSPLDPFLPLAAAQAMRAPKVGTYHTSRENSPLFAVMPNLFHKALSRLSANIAVSKSAESFILRYFPDAQFHIIPNGVDTERFSPQAEPLPHLQDGTFTILFVGRMDPRKGAKYLFAALPYLEKRLARYRLVVVGSGWMKNLYDKVIPPSLLHRVHFAGYVTPEELPRYYRSADVYCSPATHGESFGIVLLEAMAAGIPIVASDIDGYHDVVESGKEGILVPPKNPRQLAEAIVLLDSDPERRKMMSIAGRAKSVMYSWEKVVDQIEPLYRRAIEQRTPQLPMFG